MNDLPSWGGGILSLGYLNNLNHYLFSGLYSETNLGFRLLDDNEINYLNKLLSDIKCIHDNKTNLEDLLNIFDELWNLQPFYTGNTRTFIAYFKIICLTFNLPYQINIEGEIRSGFNGIRRILVVNL